MNALLGYVNDSDFRVNHRLVGWHPPRWFRLWMVAATRLADSWLWPATAVGLLAGGERGLGALQAAALAGVAANGLLVLLKGRVRRPRPCDFEVNPHFGPYRPRFSGDAFSFPSGHALNASAVLSVVALAFPPLAPLAFFVAVSVSASRVFLGVHYVTDVLAGAALGVALGAAAFAFLMG